MADATLNRSEMAQLRKLIEAHGVVETAKKLGVHHSAVSAAAGITPAVRPSTMAQIRTRLADVR